MEKFLEMIGHTLIVMSTIAIVWLVASFFNVLLHNDPLTGDFSYATWNIIVIAAELY